MTALQHWDQEWINWLAENLKRGCNRDDLQQTMRDNGFADSAIEGMMAVAYPEGDEGLEKFLSINTNYCQVLSNFKAAQKKLKKAEKGQLKAQKRYAKAKKALIKAMQQQPKEAVNTELSQWYKDLANPPLLQNPQLEQVDTDGQLQLYTLKNFMSPEECEKLIGLAESSLKPSGVTHYNGDDYFRTSETCDFVAIKDPMVQEIESRISKTIGICLPYSETIQVQRYDVGQEFKAHHDYFAPNTESFKKFATEMGQRTWTFMVYLNNTPKGGGTRFTKLEPEAKTFYPEQGTAVIWNNLGEDGVPNIKSMHHGMPVEEGKKVIITKWFRDKGHGELFHK